MSAAPPRRALITGVAGQDGSYLAEQLCGEGVEVHGTVRSRRPETLRRLEGVRAQLALHEIDLLEPARLGELVGELAPTEIYHLAAPSFVPASWEQPALTIAAITGSSATLLESVRTHVPEARVVIASSREIFGANAASPQDEETPRRPTTPYGIAKLAAHELVGLLRERDGLHLSSAILYNHESPRRPESFVTRKVSRAAAAISLGLATELTLGDLDVVRDWSAASDVVGGMAAMASASRGGDYVLASGVGRTVRELVEVAFACVGIDPAGHLRTGAAFVRPREERAQIGNPARAAEQLGWRARVSFEALISEMVSADVAALRRP